VLDSIVEYRRQGIWIELTTLIIPGWNDTDEELRGIASFIADKVGKETPWHVSRFHPTYKMLDRPATPVATLRRARQIGIDAGLRYVYEGNVPGEGGENTCCPACGKLLIRRSGFYVDENRIEMGKCPDCATAIDGIEM
jgi:pyruvate formate lyase activating enzyme